MASAKPARAPLPLCRAAQHGAMVQAVQGMNEPTETFATSPHPPLLNGDPPGKPCFDWGIDNRFMRSYKNTV